jgi:hypothetical protein
LPISPILYHLSPSEKRLSILRLGLLARLSQAAENAVFFDSLPTFQPGFDTWQVDVRGLAIEPDDTTDFSGTPEFKGHEWWVLYGADVPPERLTLISPNS